MVADAGERTDKTTTTATCGLFQTVLCASPPLSHDELQSFSLGVSSDWDTECDHLLYTSVSKHAERNEPRGHMVLILDKVGFIVSSAL